MAELARHRISWRAIGWGGAVMLLAAPFIAMLFTSDVNWTAVDFVVAGILIALVGAAFELAVVECCTTALGKVG